MLNLIIKEKKFATEILLQNINISINKPGVYGLVGKNGQGKTTLFKCALGLENCNGNCTYISKKIEMHNVAWCPTEPAVYNELTATEFYKFYAKLLDINANQKKENDFLFDVPKNKLIREFSTGMKKKVYLNAVFQKSYPVYFLDEPFNGLDLESNYKLMQYVTKQAQKNIVIISSHIMEILYANCLEIFVLKNKTVIKFEKQKFNLIEETLFS